MKRLIATGIFIIISLFLGIGLVLPKYQDFKVLQLDVKEKNISLQYKNERHSQLEKISEEIEEQKESLSKVSSALSKDPSLPALFDFFQKTTAQSGLILETLAYSGISKPKPQKGVEPGVFEETRIKEILFSLSVSGSYSAFKDFLLAVENNARIFEIKNISFSSPGESGTFSFNLSVKTHSY